MRSSVPLAAEEGAGFAYRVGGLPFTSRMLKAFPSSPAEVMVQVSPTVQKERRPMPNSPWRPFAPFFLSSRLIESPMWVAT